MFIYGTTASQLREISEHYANSLTILPKMGFLFKTQLTKLTQFAKFGVLLLCKIFN